MSPTLQVQHAPLRGNKKALLLLGNRALLLVEAGGVEPPSASTPSAALHV